jgi:septum formation protein
MIQHKKVILGSSSPRRKELLSNLKIKFDIKVNEIDETFPPEMSPFNVPEYLACLKGDTFKGTIPKDTCVITSDTVVIYNDRILGKPIDSTDALSMILELSNRAHYVVTGVCLNFMNKKSSFNNVSKVIFEEVTESEAKFYIDKFKPLDKAGAYGIQEWIGQARIKKIDGCYYNIMGLPLNVLYNELIKEKVIAF